MTKRGVRGVSSAEFVAVFPVALMVVLCLIQSGFLFMGKLTLNHATFIAARQGALFHADEGVIRAALVQALVPFYQNSTQTDPAQRITVAYARAQADQLAFLQVTRLSPNERTFADFGLALHGQRQIPNDNLRWRNNTVRSHSGVNIQDANLLKIKVVYGYPLKVPLMGALVHTLLCGGQRLTHSQPSTDNTRNCAFYAAGRVPIESWAVVEMQSPARAP